MRILIIENNPGLADEYLRFLKHTLKGKQTYVKVRSIGDAIKHLFEGQWHAVLVDTELGSPGTFQEDPDKPERRLVIRDGYDLVRFRRLVEGDSNSTIRPSFIIGLVPSMAHKRAFDEAGTDRVCPKVNIPAMAECLLPLEETK